MILESIQIHLQQHPDVGPALATYQFASGDRRPAVFTESPPPLDCGEPCITVTASAVGAPNETRGLRGGDTLATVTIYGPRNEPVANLRTLARAAWDALDRATITAAGHDVLQLRANPPGLAADAEGFPTCILTLRVRYFITEEN